MGARLGDQRAAGGQHELVAAQGLLVQLGRRQIVKDIVEILETERFDREGRIENARLSHGFLPIAPPNTMRRNI